MASVLKKAGKGLVDKTKAHELNMAVLKRIDPETEEILASSGQVCLYKMSVEDQQWQRKNIEGSMFLIKRRSAPRFKMVVLNKLSTDNYMETVHGGLELELNPPYLMYTHGDDEIHGVWFYDTADLEALGKILKKIVDQLPKPDGGTSGHDEAPPPYPPAAAAAAPPQAPMAAPSAPVSIPAASSAVAEATGGGGDDAFWDRSVHVTEDTITGQRLVPNESLVLQDTASSQQVTPAEASKPAAGLQMLLKAAHQSYHDQRQAGSSAGGGSTANLTTTRSAPVPAAAAVAPSTPPVAAAPPAGGETGPAAPTLLTPLFFQQQAAAAAAPPPAQTPPQQHPAPAPAAVPAPAQQQHAPRAAPQQPLVGNHAPGGAGAGGAAGGGSTASLQQMLNMAAARKAGVPPPGTSFGLPGNMPLPPAGGPPAPQQLQVRERLRSALTRLVANDAFVDMVAAELKAVGLMH